MTLRPKWLISLSNALRGIGLLSRFEKNIRIELWIALFIIVLCFWLNISIIEWCIISICIGSIIAAEGMNTAIEKVCDYLSLEKDERIRNIKDMASGAVLIISIPAVIAGLIILLPKIIAICPSFP